MINNPEYDEALSSLTRAASLEEIEGFQSEIISDDHGYPGDNGYATQVVYPDDMMPGETLPVIILEGGDGAKSNYYSNYLNNFNTLNGTSLPRAIYVLASPYKVALKNGEYKENDNSYSDVTAWMNKQAVTPSQIGIQAFSNGGGVGLKMALQAANDNKDIGIVLFLNDAEQGESNSLILDHSQLKEDVANDISNCDNLMIVGSKGLYGYLFDNIRKEYPDICYEIKGDWGKDHTMVRRTSLQYNFLLSMMGLTDKIPEKFEIIAEPTNEDFWQKLADIYNLSSIEESKKFGLEYLNTKLGTIYPENIVSNDQIYVANYMNAIRSDFDSINYENLYLFDDPSGLGNVICECIDEYKQTSVVFKMVIEKTTTAGIYISSKQAKVDEDLSNIAHEL